MKTNHVNGPWFYKTKGFQITIGNQDTGVTKNGHDYTVAKIEDNSFTAEANAKLIAAAPDLLDALVTILKSHRQMSFNQNHSLSDSPIEQMAQNAINKATK